ncbi:MAG TPA: hypothetical protein H9774_08290 [Candidatus Desulfovibrio gallistercoris]|nr:hypothetical protein [Candidatus Desulfovibrio gallistercoris]
MGKTKLKFLNDFCRLYRNLKWMRQMSKTRHLKRISNLSVAL